MTFSSSCCSGFRSFLRRRRLFSFGKTRAAIDATLADSDLLDVAMQAVHDKFGAFPDGILQLLAFLFEHADEIIALVVQIIDLFSAAPTGEPVTVNGQVYVVTGVTQNASGEVVSLSVQAA